MKYYVHDVTHKPIITTCPKMKGCRLAIGPFDSKEDAERWIATHLSSRPEPAATGDIRQPRKEV